MPQLKEFKVAWIDPGNPALLHSTMYDTLQDAERNAPPDAMIMQLRSASDSSYSWTVLPYGSGTHLRAWYFLYRNLIYITAFTITATVIYLTVRK